MKIKSVKKPAAKKTVARKRAAGGASKAPAAKNVAFTVHADKGKAVYLAGEFNGWNPTAKKMAYKAKSGLYAASVKLEIGKTYQYKFVIDGTWCADPQNVNAVPNDQGTFNSVVTVR
ncbi:MAG: glycoside hydrolase family 13 [Kiritimatiellae bacterium]|nr:glycoside hydrolase family 13 [Kiritimatiellia bacterium]